MKRPEGTRWLPRTCSGGAGVDLAGAGELQGAHAIARERMASVREAFRLHRLAHAHRCLWAFYLEHNLFDEARMARQLMIEVLRSASEQWRLTLGLARRARASDPNVANG